MKKTFVGEDGKTYHVKEKKPFYKKWWFILIAIIVVLSFLMPKGDNTNTANNAEISYNPVAISQMNADLKNNALKAEKTYKDQYVEISGKVIVIDSSGQYISIADPNDEFAIIGITCYLKNDDQRNIVSELSNNQIVTVKGKVTQVGEVLGYSLDVNEIIAQ